MLPLLGGWPPKWVTLCKGQRLGRMLNSLILRGTVPTERLPSYSQEGRRVGKSKAGPGPRDTDEKAKIPT